MLAVFPETLNLIPKPTWSAGLKLQLLAQPCLQPRRRQLRCRPPAPAALAALPLTWQELPGQVAEALERMRQPGPSVQSTRLHLKPMSMGYMIQQKEGKQVPSLFQPPRADKTEYTHIMHPMPLQFTWSPIDPMGGIWTCRIPQDLGHTESH